MRRAPALDEYIERYPELADEIRDLFPAMVKVERIDGVRRRVEGKQSGDALAASPPPLQIGDYRILREIGRGGMGVVYEADQISLGRHVALKVLPRQVSGDPTVQERFRREARAAGGLHHTNIVPVYDVGQDGDFRFYAMQFIQGHGLDLVITELRRLRAHPGTEPEMTAALDGASLRIGGEASRSASKRTTVGEVEEQSAALESILGGRFDPQGPSNEIAGVSPYSGSAILPGGTQLSSVEPGRHAFFRSLAEIGRQVAGGLAYAHSRGIVHRDIKPSNLLLDTAGVVWITDFGLAKGDDDGLTQSGDFLGTIRYMAPERFRGGGDGRADVYALGLTLYELLTLRSGFASSDRLALIDQIKNAEPSRPRTIDARIPRDLETIVLKAIEKDPKARYQSVEAMGEDLRRFLADEPIRAREIGAVERSWRWARRNPGTAALGGALAGALVLATVSSLLAAGYFNQAARSERAARREGELLRQAEWSQRQRAETEKKRADITLADMFTSRGLLAGERGAAAEAVHWFAAAADQSASALDLARVENNRLRARNWMRQAILPVAAMWQSGDPKQLDFQPRGDLLLARADDGAMSFWSWRDGKRLAWAEELSGSSAVHWSPDGASVAVGFHSGEVQIRQATNGEVRAKIEHRGPISALAYSRDGKFLAIAGKSVRVWDINGQAFLNSGSDHPRQVTALMFNRKGDRLITVCDDKLVRVFAVQGGLDGMVPLYSPLVHTAASPPALVEEDRILITVSRESELSRWDMATGKLVAQPIHTRPWNLGSVVASPDRNWFATSGYSGVELYAVDARQPPVYLRHTNRVASFAFSPDGRALLSVSWDQTARLWSVPDGQPLGQPLPHMARRRVVPGLTMPCTWPPANSVASFASGSARWMTS